MIWRRFGDRAALLVYDHPALPDGSRPAMLAATPARRIIYELMLSDQIRNDLNAAMKAGDSLRVSVLRMLLSAFNYKKIDLQRDLTRVDEIAVTQNEAKKRREAIESYRAGGRKELEEQESRELEMLQTYLPKEK